MLDLSRLRRQAGFGMAQAADAYVYQPESEEQVLQVFEVARRESREVVLRGAGLSYGDAAILPEAVGLDLTKMNRVLAWDPDTGVIEAEAGATIEDLWRRVLPDGWWPPVVSGTMFPTLGGALSMNVHGKNAFRVGPLGEHVIEVSIISPSGTHMTMTPADPLFEVVISGAGLLATIVGVKLQMKKVPSGDLRVLAVSCRNWAEQFAAFDRFEADADYLVSWIDCFSGGRGLVHAAWYADGPPSSLLASHQDLPAKALGVVPKSQVWRLLRPLNNRLGMRAVNAAKYLSSKLIGNGKEHRQSLVAFSFLLDYVPNWRNSYLPGGFIQYQSFVPKAHAERVFATQLEWQQQERLESFLGVLKRHREDTFSFSHGVDGFSFALDFKVTDANRSRLWRLCHRMNDLVLDAGGRFYFAKDSTLRPEDVRRFLSDEAMARFREAKEALDPDGVLSSSLGRRVGLLR